MTSSDREVIGALLLGESPVMHDVRERIARIARTALPILIEGPTGAGKELVAAALHRVSGRSGECVAINVCAISEGMFEDAMFGHARGAFTGAMADHVGYLTEAHRGTIFLDEIGGLGLAPQAALLRAIETKRFRPIGSRHDHTSDFRVVSATNVPLDVLASRASFRSDLIERLRGARIELPALAARGDDSLLLASHFAGALGAELSAGAKRVIREYSWPGNVRQLRNAVEYATLMHGDAGQVCGEAMRDYIGSLRCAVEGVASSGVSSPSTPATFRDRRLLDVLAEVRGDVAEAARILGVHRATLYRRLRRLEQRTPHEMRGSYATPGAPLSELADERSRTRVSQRRATERDSVRADLR